MIADVRPDSSPTSKAPEPGAWGRSPIRKVLLIGGIALFASFWTWALFFASKESINRIGDHEWAERAEGICQVYDPQIRAIAGREDPDLDIRAGLVDESTDLLTSMLDEVVAVEPADEKGRAIVPAWEADYRLLLEDRYEYADKLRAGEDVAFTESIVEGVPVTERIEKFTGDNRMTTCGPPRGSVI